MTAYCEICLLEVHDSQLKLFRWPDAANGSDIDGFCCKECYPLSAAEQYQKYCDCRGARAWPTRL